MNHRTRGLMISIGFGLLTGCTATTMESVRREPGFRSDDLRRVLVVGFINNHEIRKSLEEEFVRQWKDRGVTAVSSLAVLSSTAPCTRTDAAAAAKSQKVDAVLVARLLSREHVPKGEQPAKTIGPAASEAEQVNTVLQVLLSPPVQAQDYDLVTVQTNLYDVASERQVWSGMSETRVLRKVPSLIPPFVKIILKHLYEKPS